MITKHDERSPSGCPEEKNPCPFCVAMPQGAPLRSVRREVGSVLLRHDAPVDEIWCVRSGRVKLSVVDVTGAERAYGMRGPGSVLGLEALLGLPALFDAHVEVEGELRHATPDAFARWIEQDPSLVDHAMKHVLAEAVRFAAERKLLDGTAESRLARFLLAREHNPFLAAWSDARRHDVAGLLGMRPETLSRTIRGFEQQGVIDADMRVIDLPALRGIAGENHEQAARRDEY